MAMATAVANKDKSIMEYLAIAKSALATAEIHGQVLATTFPDTFLAGARAALGRLTVHHRQSSIVFCSVLLCLQDGSANSFQ